MFLTLSDIEINYLDEKGEKHTQPLSDIFQVGTLIDPDSGDDMEPEDDVTITSNKDGYIIVRGGLVQNEPIIPVIDLDVLDTDGPYDGLYVDDCLETLQTFVTVYEYDPRVKDIYLDEILRLIEAVKYEGVYQQHVLLSKVLKQLDIPSDSVN